MPTLFWMCCPRCEKRCFLNEKHTFSETMRAAVETTSQTWCSKHFLIKRKDLHLNASLFGDRGHLDIGLKKLRTDFDTHCPRTLLPTAGRDPSQKANALTTPLILLFLLRNKRESAIYIYIY